jgi:hypothetical protein
MEKKQCSRHCLTGLKPLEKGDEVLLISAAAKANRLDSPSVLIKQPDLNL